MDHQKVEQTTALIESDAELAECWSGETEDKSADTFVNCAVDAMELLSDAERHPVESCEDEDSRLNKAAIDILGRLITLFAAERGFAFRIERDTTGQESQLKTVPWITADLDGEEVQHPERKAPMDAVRSVAESGIPARAPIEHSNGTTLPGDESHQSILLPLKIRSAVCCVLFLENRFRPMSLSRSNILTARFYAHVLESFVWTHELRKENRSLWNDVSLLRETPPSQVQTLALASSSSAHGKRRQKNAQRSDLRGDYSMIVGNSPRMMEIFQVLDRVSSSNAPVLINGESGTGKELVANAIHTNSGRNDRPFVSENCGALTETLLESELFGYMKGAFTGATKDRKGLFELAAGGTLFLDEVGDMSPTMQKKLLRVLQEKVVRRVGGKELIPVDVRIISATNKDLQEEVRAGAFREDLYYRLNVINLKLPPLRERKDDVEEIVHFFLKGLAADNDVEKKIEPAAMTYLTEYDWPGNIRELQNEVKRLYALADGDIRVADLSENVLRGDDRRPEMQNLERDLANMTLKEAVERVEEFLIRNALIECRGNKSLVAKKLSVPKTSLYNKISRYQLGRL